MRLWEVTCCEATCFHAFGLAVGVLPSRVAGKASMTDEKMMKLNVLFCAIHCQRPIDSLQAVESSKLL